MHGSTRLGFDTPRRHVDQEAYRTNNIIQFIKVNLSSLQADTF